MGREFTLIFEYTYMLSHRWAKALAVGALVLASIALILFVAAIFSQGDHRMSVGDGGKPCHLSGMGKRCMDRGMGMDGGVQMMSPSAVWEERDMMSAPVPDEMMKAMPVPMMESMPMVSGTVVSAERKVSTTASLDLRAKSLDWTVNKIRDIAKNVGGFVEYSSMSQPERGIRTAWVTIKVPADRFETTLTEVKQAADQVTSENMGSTDMTGQYIDLSARLNNKRAEEKAYENLLNSAAKVSDVIEVTQRLTQVRSEIESLEQQLRYLDGQTELATLSVSVTEDPQVQANPGEFQRGNVFKTALNTLVDALLALGSGLVVFIISGLPVLLIMLGLLWVVYRVAKRVVDGFFGRL